MVRGRFFRRRSFPHLNVDATMKVKLEVLQRVYESLQDRGDHTQVEREVVDPESHLFFIDAYEMPRWVWSQERGTFERYCRVNSFYFNPR